jgi:hypothetical protein
MFICHAGTESMDGSQERIWMPVFYKVVIPETGDVHRFDPHQYGKAVERWHEEITWLDCDTFVIRVNASQDAEEEQIEMWYLRDYPAFSCPSNCSWCTKFQIARSRYLGVSPITAAAEAKQRYLDWKEGRLDHRDSAGAEGAVNGAVNLEHAV